MAGRSELREALAGCRSAFLATALLTGVINVLMLTGSVYMLAVYDRVLVSRSVPTLVGVTVIAVAMYGFLAVMEILRARLLTRIGTAVEESVVMRVRDMIVRLAVVFPSQKDALAPLRDLDQIRGFLSSTGPAALFDLPWIPLYLAIAFAFHPLIGVAVVVGALVLIGLTIITEILSRGPSQALTQLMSRRNGAAETARRNAEVVTAMGMEPGLTRRFAAIECAYVDQHLKAANRSATLGSISRIMRTLIQSLVLGLGAWLVIKQEASGGVMIASSILTSRALAPVEQAIANWRGFMAARESWARLKSLLERLPPHGEVLPLPAPRERLEVEGLSLVPPGGQQPVLREVAFALAAGEGVGVIGPSASGKSSLARALVGIWPAGRGTVRLDGAAVAQWTPQLLGRHIGYLPQDVELIDGTIAENISRFDPDADPEAIVAAARAAGVHDMILGLADGYDTRLGDGGTMLSAGQSQRVALARALYGAPFLVVLDEPNSNLDSEGEAALVEAIRGVRERGGIAVVIAHRPSALASVDRILVMKDGMVQAFGPREEVMAKMLRASATPAQPAPAAPQAKPGAFGGLSASAHISPSGVSRTSRGSTR